MITQTYKDIEIVVIDDGSKDGTYNVVKKYADEDKRIILIKIANSGPGGARNVGISKANGEYITFVDADDFIYPNYIEKLHNTLMLNNADLVICNIERKTGEGDIHLNAQIDKEEKYMGREAVLSSMQALMQQCIINSLYCKMYKSSIIKQNNIFMIETLDMGEDFLFNLDYIEYVENMVVIPDALYQYVEENSFLSKKHRENLFDKRKVSIEKFSEFIDNNNMDDNMVHFLYIKLLFSDCIQMWDFRDKYSRKDRIKRIKELCNKEQIIESKKNLKPRGMFQLILYLILKLNCASVVDVASWLFGKVRKKHSNVVKRASI